MNNNNFSFRGKDISVFGGMKLVEKFLKKEKIEEIIAKNWKNRKKSNHQNNEVGIIMSSVVGKLGEAQTSAELSRVVGNWALQEMAGVQGQSSSTLSRFYNSLNFGLCVKIEEMIKVLTHRTMGVSQEKSATIDCDSTVNTVYGNQEGSAKGYNPQKPGRKSYHALMGFVAESESFLHGTIRPGNSVSLTSVKPFMQEMLGKLPQWVEKIRIRMDSGFFSAELFEFLMNRGIEFFCTVRMTETIKRLIWSVPQQEWKKIDKKREIAQIKYPLMDLRMIVVREVIADERNRPQGKLLVNVPGYAFSGVITNAKWGSAVEIWRWRNQRGDVENRIKEFKEDFWQKLSCRSFWANQGIFLLSVLAYELFNLLRKKYFRSHQEQHQRFKTFFHKYILIAVRKIRPQNRLTYLLDSSYRFQEEFKRLINLLA